jgi:hypothetical protein
MLLCLPAGRLRTVRLLLWCGPEPDFSEHDHALLALLRRHLHRTYLDAEGRRSTTPQLTPPHLGTAATGRRRAHQHPVRPDMSPARLGATGLAMGGAAAAAAAMWLKHRRA